MKAKIILFDIDGTLIKAQGSGTTSLNKVIEKLFGVKKICDTFSLQGCTDKMNFESAFINACGKKPSKKDIDNITAEYLKLLPSEVSKSVKKGAYKKVEGINNFLLLLSKEKDVFLGLGTGNIKDGGFLKLKPSGLLKFFTFGGYGCDSHIRSKVLIKAVKRAEKLSGMEFEPKNVYVIGDTHKDIIAAKEAGYHSGIVLDGFGDKKLIMKNGPELIAEDFSDLTPWLIWLGLKKDPKGIRRGTYVCPDTPIEHAHFGMTGMDLGDNEESINKLRRIKNKGRLMKEKTCAIVYSGGKDSHLALIYAVKSGFSISSLTLFDGGENHSKYFHDFPKIEMIRAHSNLLNFPLLVVPVAKKFRTKNIKENVAVLISENKKKFDFDSFIIGISRCQRDGNISVWKNAVENTGLKFYAPILGFDLIYSCRVSVELGVVSIITGVEKAQVDKKWLGREIDEDFISYLEDKKKKGKNIDGGGIQTMVVQSPLFSGRIEPDKFKFISTKEQYLISMESFSIFKKRRKKKEALNKVVF